MSRLFTRGFTIIELLIVIVIIGILATLTVVVYNGITQNVLQTNLQNDVKGLQSKLEKIKQDSGSYPGSIADLTLSGGVTAEYTSDGTFFCLTLTNTNAKISYYGDNSSTATAAGACAGHVGYIDPTYIMSASVGYTHSCALKNSKAYCWGGNQYGSLGNGSNTDSNAPVAVSVGGVLAGKKVTSVASGTLFSCALASGSVYCWGRNSSGQLGDGTNTDSNVPVAVSTSGVLSGKLVSAIAVGSHSVCALSGGKGYCWGANSTSGVLGDGTNINSNVPVAMVMNGALSGKTITKIDVGVLTACAIAGGQAYCWGNNGEGQQGCGGVCGHSNVPVAVSTSGVLSGKTITDISVGDLSTCAVADGKAYCWGDGTYGQLGDGTNTDKLTTPGTVSASGVLSGKTVTAVGSGERYSCALADNKIYCWGDNTLGTLGTGNTTSSNVPVAVSTSGTLSGKTIKTITSHWQHLCAVTDTQEFCFGLGTNGQLGNGTSSSSSSAVLVNSIP